MLYFDDMDTPVADIPPVLRQAITRLLRPLVRLLIRYNVSYTYFSQMLKSVYVDVAERDFPAPGGRATDSRITMLTGVHRKDVRVLRGHPPETLPVAKTVALSAQVAGTWLSAAPYCGEQGEPRLLYRLAADGEPSFETLVEHVSRQDLRARSLLDEWLRLGVVRMTDEGLVELRADAFVPAQGFDEKVYVFGMAMADHMSASVHNLAGEQPPRFDRCVYYTQLRPESVNELDAMCADEAMAMLKSVNRRARDMQLRDAGDPEATERFALGVYFNRDTVASNRGEAN